MLKFNRDKIRKITSEILTALERLKDLKKFSADDFLSESHKIGSAKYSFIVAIEGMIDLCNHIIAKNSYRAPEDTLIFSEFWPEKVHLTKNTPIH